jgi:hypothetical protein
MPDQFPHTRTPNAFLDEVLPRIDSLGELKVSLIVIRKTLGWHKDTDLISLSQLQRLTGLTRPTILRGIEMALRRGTIFRRAVGGSYRYGLLEDPARWSPPGRGKDSLPGRSNSFTRGGKAPLPEVVKRLYPQKKEKDIQSNRPFSLTGEAASGDEHAPVTPSEDERRESQDSGDDSQRVPPDVSVWPEGEADPVYALWEQEAQQKVSLTVAQVLDEMTGRFGQELVLEAIREATRSTGPGRFNLKYVLRIAERWMKG